jgi:hypothetical protein
LLFAVLAAAVSGLAIGLRFRVNMLFAASSVFGIATIAAALFFGWSLGRTIGVLLILLVVQQSAYLIGLFAVARSAKRPKVRSGDMESSTSSSSRGSAKPVKKH